jgi:membrane protease YdiL (CAAX protease family)
MRFLLNKFVGLLFLIIILGSISGSIAALFGIQIQINYLRYAIVIALYIYILVLVWLDLEHLALFNLDRTTLVLIVVFGILRSRLDVKNEGFYKGVILVLALSILVACFKNWKNVPKTNWHWAAIGILACLSVIPLSFVESLQPEKYTNLNISSDILGVVLIRGFLKEFSFVAILEETTFRGILWGYLRKFGWKENKIFWGQAIFFWLLHLWQIGSPITFFFTIPASIFIYSLLAHYSKQLFPSIFAHSFINVVGPILVHYYLM